MIQLIIHQTLMFYSVVEDSFLHSLTGPFQLRYVKK